MSSAPALTSTTAPGKVFASRSELAEHYKSDWHRYNLKRREAGLPLLQEADFQARLQAALALKQEREGKQERSGTNHLKNKNKKKNKQQETTVKSQAAANDRIKEKSAEQEASVNDDAEMNVEETSAEEQAVEEEPPVIEPRQCLFDKHMSPSVEANLERMQRKYGFFVPDQEYLVDMEGLVGYCQEKVKLGHYCLYCQKVFSTWQGCQKHMISTRHTKLRYEAGIDMEEFDPFFDFSEADEDFLGTIKKRQTVAQGQGDEEEMEEDDADWEDVTDDEDEDMQQDNDEDMMDDEGDAEGMYAGYEDEIAKYGLDVTPLGELVFPDGRIIGHRGLARYYKQRLNPTQDTAAVVAARRAAGERMYNGRVYNVNRDEETKQSALALSRVGVAKGANAGGGNGILVASKGGSGYTAVSLYRYRAVVKKARRDDARGQRLQQKTRQNINRMDKKANRLMNDQSVAHAKR
jgi:pre-60S factor REI1